jgi:hypothetical protein
MAICWPAGSIRLWAKIATSWAWAFGVSDSEIAACSAGEVVAIRDRFASASNAGDGSDIVAGGGGNDQTFDWAGCDKLDGGLGNHRLDGGAGLDILVGGVGVDDLNGV